MLLETLHIVNFRSHKNTKLNFQYGTTVIVGDNGSGKSTIIDAVLFALSGERWEKREGLKLDNFIMWNENGMSVSLTFTADGVLYRVKRGKILNRSTTATLDIRNDDGWKNIASRQRGVDEKLGEILNLNEIDTSVVRQGELAKILKQKPTERKEYFHKLLNLEDMEKFYDNFGKFYKDFEDKANELKGKVGNENDIRKKKEDKLKEIVDLKKEKENLEKEKENLERNMAEKKKVCDEEEIKKEKFVQISGEISICENNLKNIRNRIDEKEKELKEIEEIEKIIPSLKEEAKNFEILKIKVDKATEILNLKNIYVVFKDKEKEYNRHISKISELQRDEDNYSKIYKEVENLKEKISDLKRYVEEVERLDKEEKEKQNKVLACQRDIEKTEKKYFDIFEERCDIEKIKNVPRHIEFLKKEIDELAKKTENFKGKEHELKARLKNLDAQRKAHLDEDEKIKRAYNDTEKKISNCEMYIKETEKKYFDIFDERCSIEKIKGIPSVIKKLQEEIENLTKEMENLTKKEIELGTMLKNIEKQKDELSKAKTTCPVCESQLPENKKINLLNNLNNNNEKFLDELKEIKKKTSDIGPNKDKKNKRMQDIEGINIDLFVAKFNEMAELKIHLEEIKKDLADKQIRLNESENEEKQIHDELEKTKKAIEKNESEKAKQNTLLRATESINSELYASKQNELNELNQQIEKIINDKINADEKKKEYELDNLKLNEENKIFNELKKKHDDYIGSKKFVESTNIEEIKKGMQNFLNEINDMIGINNLPCTIENVEEYISKAKKELAELEKKKELLNRYEERIKNKDEITNFIKEDKIDEEELTKKKNEFMTKRTALNYDERHSNEILKIYEYARKKHQEADKNFYLNEGNIKNCENIINDIETDLKKIEDAKKENEILNAFINFSKEIREKFGRNGIQKDISQSFFPILETYTNNLFSTFGFSYDGAEIYEDEENCNINLKKGGNTISSASLSGGEKSALSIAMNAALSKIIGRADFLILDEPTESLDEGKISELIEILKEFKGVSQLIVISHDRDFKNATRSRIEVYKEKGISHIAGEESENKEFDDEGDESESNESNESKGVKNLENMQQGLFEY